MAQPRAQPADERDDADRREDRAGLARDEPQALGPQRVLDRPARVVQDGEEPRDEEPRDEHERRFGEGRPEPGRDRIALAEVDEDQADPEGRQRQQEVLRHPLIRKATELFDAELLEVVEAPREDEIEHEPSHAVDRKTD